MHAIAVAQNNATGSAAVRVGIDLAKDVFELAFADASGRIIERKRLSREAFAIWQRCAGRTAEHGSRS